MVLCRAAATGFRLRSQDQGPDCAASPGRSVFSPYADLFMLLRRKEVLLAEYA